MPLPEPFSDVEHWQRVVRREYNDEIRNHFRDKFGDSGSWDAEIETTRGQMLQALLHQDSDPVQLTLGRMQLYQFVFTQRQEMPIVFDETKRPTDDFTYKPEIKLYFTQSRRSIPKDQPPATGEITYRLMTETSESLTEANVKIRAERIKRLFTEPNLFVWHKGKELFNYTDKLNGYHFQLLVTTETEAKRIIEQILNIEQKAPDWNKLIHRKDERTYTNVVQTKRIYGKNRKVPRRRPTEDVKFRYASIKINGIPRPIYIVDCRYGEPLIKTAA
jgi:hypothetical protein